MDYNEETGKSEKYGTSPVPTDQAHWKFLDQPERSKREDSISLQLPEGKGKEAFTKIWDELEEMRCSEHYGNIVRDK